MTCFLNLNKYFLKRYSLTIFFLLCCTLYATSYLGRLNYSAAMTVFISDNTMTQAFAGLVSTVYFFVYGSSQMLSGFLADKLSPRLLPVIGMVLSSICNILMSILAPSHAYLVLWGLNGFAHSLLWPSLMRVLVEYFPEESRFKTLSYITVSVPIGTLASYFLSATLLKVSTVSAVFIVPAILMIIAVTLFYLFFPKHKYADLLNSQEVTHHKVKNVPLATILLSPLVLSAIFPAFTNGVIKDGLSAWVPSYINSNFDSGAVIAILISSILPIFNLIGVFSMTRLKKRINNDYILSAIYFLIAFVSMLMLTLFGTVNLYTSAVLLAVCSSSMLAVNTIFVSYIPVRFVKEGRVAFMSGLLNSVSYLGATVSGIAIGILNQDYGWTLTMAAFSLLLIIAATICTIFSKKVMPKDHLV